MEKYENQAVIKISKNDEEKFLKNGKLSFNSDEERQGFLYKYGKEYLLELELSDGSKCIVFSKLNIKKILKYGDEHNGVSVYAYKLIEKTSENIKNGILENNLSKLDIEFLLTEFEPNQRKQLLSLIDGNNNLPKRKMK